MCKGSSTVSQQNAPNPVFLQAYQNVLGQAQNLSSQPLNLYPANTSVSASNPLGIGAAPTNIVAPLQTGQRQAINQGNNQQAWNATLPWLNQGNQFLNNSQAPIWGNTQQFSPNAINQYENPYTQQVVQSTEQQLQNVNQQQLTQLQGNAASQGALGGDRAGVAQAVLMGQQDAQEAPTIAGLESQGYGQALQEFNTQQQAQLGANEAQNWLASQGAFASGQFGQQALGIQQANMNQELGVGGLEQQEAQENLNVPYYQFEQQQAYPFQTTSWLANIAEGTGSLAGGTGSTSYPPPSALSQIAGLGVAGAGAYGLYNNLSGGSGNSAAAANAMTADINAYGNPGLLPTGGAGVWQSRGGRIQRRAGGGGILSATPPSGTSVPDISVSIVPGGVSPTLASVPDLSGSIVPYGSSGRQSPFVSQLANPGSTSSTSGGGNPLGTASSLAGIGSFLAAVLRSGGRVPPYAGGGGILGSKVATHFMPPMRRGIAVPMHMRPHFDDGGVVALPGEADINVPLSPADAAAYNPVPPVGAFPYAGVPPQGYAGGDYGAPLALRPASGQGIAGAQSGNAAPDAPSLGAVPATEGSDAATQPPADGGPGIAPAQDAQPVVSPSGASYAINHATGKPFTETEAAQYAAAPPPGYQVPQQSGIVPMPIPTAQPSGGITRAGDLLSQPQAGSLSDRVVPAQEPAAQPIPTGSGITATPASYTPPAASGGAGSGGNGGALGRYALPLMAAGFGMMAGRSPYALANIGEGGLAGVRTLEEMPKMRQEQAQAEMTEAQAQYMRNWLGGGPGSGGTGIAGPGAPSGGGIAGSGGGSLPVYSSSGQPMFDLGQMVRQAQGWIASPFEPLQKAGQAQMALVERMFDKGLVPSPNGGVMPLPGAAEAAARQAAMISTAEAPAKMAESVLSRAGQPIKVTGNEVVTTGAAALPPEYQRLIGSILGGNMGSGAAAPAGQQGGQQQTGADPYLHFASLVSGPESGGNPDAKNPRSSASGTEQFIDSTWLSTFKRAMPDVAAGMSDQQILSLRSNPQISQQMGAQYARENAPAIAGAGFPVSNASLYLAHRFGPQGAVQIMNAPASAPIDQIVGPQVMRANPDLAGQTAGTVVQRAAVQFGTQPFEQPAGAAMRGDNQPPTSFIPSQPPAPGVSNVTQAPPDLPPSRATSSTQLVRNPDGSLTATNNPFVRSAQEKMGTEIGGIPTEIDKLRQGQAGLTTMMAELKQNAQGPQFYNTGWGSEFRQGFAKAVNGTAATLGLNPPLSQDSIANNEAFIKSSTNAAFALARSMVGARVAVAEVLQAGKANPSMANSVFGNIAVTNMLLQENKRQIDRNSYVFDQAQRGASPVDAGGAFDRTNPPDRYYAAAMADSVRYYFPKVVDALKASPSVPNIEAFDRRYGAGAAELLLGRQ